jgi:glycosyltransferase involved in cell wall biosynthesis
LDQLRNIDIKKEILIIDDNSNQETKDWLKEQLDIRLFTYDYDIGVSQARNL